MSYEKDMEPILFSFQFIQCESDPSVYYSKLDDINYVVLRIFGEHTIDIIHERYIDEENPCNAKPVREKSIKLSFEPGKDDSVLRDFYEHWRSKVK